MSFSIILRYIWNFFD